MRIYSLFYMALFVAMTSTSGCQQKIPANEQPNLIYVFPDQYRKQAMAFWDQPAFAGSIRTKADPVKTPRLDKFATEALVLTNMVSNCPLCSPHRGSLFTGQFPGSSGVSLNCNSDRPISSLREDAECLSDVLKDAGYHLGYIGKWHLDYPTPNDPANPGNYVDPRRPAWDAYTPAEKRHGFDFWYSYGTWDVHKDPHYYDTYGNRTDPKEWSPQHEADKAIAYLKNENNERDPSKPFALFVSMNPPHNPYASLDDCLEEDYLIYKDMTAEQLLVRDNANHNMDKAHSAAYYFAMVTGVDREFGRIMDQLKTMGQDENTIVVFTSDHGETMTSQGTNDPKNSIYTEAIDVPFLIRWPQKIKAKTDNLLMGTPDIMPTLLGLMGLKDKIPTEVQGSDYSPILLDKKNASRPKSALYLRNVNGDKDENNKVTSYFPVARGIKSHQYSLELKINRQNELISTLFFDDDNDPYQLRNLPVDKKSPEVQKLLQEMAYWLKHSNDPWYQQKILSNWIPYQ
jgi:arylsulfatase A-like enzyme